jgi:hypothetical protein
MITQFLSAVPTGMLKGAPFSIAAQAEGITNPLDTLLARDLKRSVRD